MSFQSRVRSFSMVVEANQGSSGVIILTYIYFGPPLYLGPHVVSLRIYKKIVCACVIFRGIVSQKAVRYQKTSYIIFKPETCLVVARVNLAIVRKAQVCLLDLDS